MVQVHVPQGVGVRVPPWAPTIRKQSSLKRTFFSPINNEAHKQSIALRGIINQIAMLQKTPLIYFSSLGMGRRAAKNCLVALIHENFLASSAT